MDRTESEINLYLAYEWGLYDELDPPSNDRPFKLELCGKISTQVVYRFTDDTGEPHYAGITGEGEERTFWSVPAWGMEFEDFADALRGFNWLYSQDRVDLCPERIHEGRPPSRLRKQRAVIEDLARKAFGPGVNFELLVGYQFKKSNQFVALARAKSSGKSLFVGSRIDPVEIGWPNASPDFRIGLALARYCITEKGI